VVVPAAIIGGVMIYGIKKAKEMSDDFPSVPTEPRPTPPIPTFPS
jgi:hypothetical protein